MFKKKGESAKNIKEEYILAPRIMADNSNREGKVIDLLFRILVLKTTGL